MTCITAQPLDTRSIYPVIDPHRTAGPGPWKYGYAFAWDGVQITVQRDSTLGACRMEVTFVSSLQEQKEIQAWNLFSNTFVSRVGSSSLGLRSGMNIFRAGIPGEACGDGADTLVLCRYFAWPRGRTALYTFDATDLWEFWGGCNVTFNWFTDTQGSGRWGDQTPPVVYPVVRFPDRTVLHDSSGAGFLVVMGGAAFAADFMYLAAMGIAGAPQLPFSQLPPSPADGVLVRELDRAPVFVVFGGAKFWIPDPATLFSLGFDWSQVRVIPQGGAAQLAEMPFDGTLIKEQHDPRVFFVQNRRLSLVMSPSVLAAKCLSFRSIRTVPDHALTGLQTGPNL